MTVGQVSLESDGPLTAISSEDLLSLIEIKESQPFRQSLVRNSIRRLYSTRLFHDVQVSAVPAPEGLLHVTFALIRRYVVHAIDFSGSVELPRDRLRRALRLRVGDPYSQRLLEDSLSQLRSVYETHGYYQAQFEPLFQLDQPRARIQVEFRIQAGPQARVGELSLDIRGDLESREIESIMSLKKGGPYSDIQKDADLEAIRQLLAEKGYLNALAFVDEGFRYDPATNQVELPIRIAPRERTLIEFAGDQPSPEKLRGLPVFTQGSAEIFLQETAEELTNRYQLDAYFLATVTFESSAESAGRIVFRIDKGEKLSLKEVRFEGHQFAGRPALLGLVSVQTAGFFNRGKLTNRLIQEDLDRIRSFYQQQGFLDAEASHRLERGKGDRLFLIYRIQEGRRYTVESLSLSGNEKLGDERLMQEIVTRENGPFSPLLAAQDRAAVIAAYENLGYRQVDFRSEIAPDSANRVHVRYFIREGPQTFVDQVILTGALSTRSRVIEREVAVEPGEPLSLGAVLETEANLYSLAVFNRVQVQEAPSFKDPAYKTVIVNVEEAKKYTLIYGIGYSSFEGPRGTVGITNSNFLGLARSITFGLRAGALRQRAHVAYTLPRIFQRKLPTVLSFTADNERAQTTSTLGVNRALRGRPFDSFRLTGSIQTERRLSRRESLFFRYRYEDVSLNVPDNLAAPLEFFREQENLRLSSFSASYLNESRDDPTDPARGYFLSGDALATTRYIGSDEELLRLFFQGQYYRRIHPKLVWASALRVGLIGGYGRTESVPISERFFSGGATTLRGLPQDLAGPLLRDDGTGEIILVDEDGNLDPDGRPVPLGGNALWIFNTELRFPIVGFVKGAAFYDVGNVYSRILDLFRDAPTHAVGFGLHLSTPIGPLRFDLGYNPDPPAVPGFRHFNFHFTLGHPF